MKKFIYLLIFFLSNVLVVKSQNANYKPIFDNQRPNSPAAYEFQKYTEHPVSEFTGTPSTSIPLYQIKVDEVTIPINLSYNSSGIKVTQEASWVGLGWDVSVGSIVQTVNDQDDTNFGFVKRLPDYNESHPTPTLFPYRYDYPTSNAGGGWSNPYPIQPMSLNGGFKIATDFYMPVNGVFINQEIALALSSQYDSEPDIFTFNVGGKSLNFSYNFSTAEFVPLSDKNFKISCTDNKFLIIDPIGVRYEFSLINNVYSYQSEIETLGNVNFTPQSNGEGVKLSSKIWLLTKITTSNNKTLTFEYDDFGRYHNFSSYSEKKYSYSLFSSNYLEYAHASGYPNLNSLFPLLGNYSSSYENRIYLKTINFPNGRVQFNSSNRDDVLGAKKLDKINIYNGIIGIPNNRIKSINFNFNYFNSNNLLSNSYIIDNQLSSVKNLRLKLMSVNIDNEDYLFDYDQNQLPSKNSFAIDFWGYFNGVLLNNNTLPNPSRFNIPGLPDNGNNHSSNEVFCQSGILKSITYPTKGKVAFNYQLNEFSNYYVPDFSTTNNILSHGLGLRIKSINHFDQDNSLVKEKIFEYNVGIAVNPTTYFRNFKFPNVQIRDGSHISIDIFDVKEINGSGYSISGLFNSHSGVGYSQVSSYEFANGLNKGKIVNQYSINANKSVQSYYEGGTVQENSIPGVKYTNGNENGSILSSKIYDSDAQLIRQTNYEYLNWMSMLSYGARFFSYSSYFYPVDAGTVSPYYTTIPQTLIGYYPIFDFKSLLNKEEIINYFYINSVPTSTNLVKSYSYDDKNQITSVIEQLGTNRIDKYYSYPYNDLSNLGYQQLMAKNRISEQVGLLEVKVDLSTPSSIGYGYKDKKNFELINNLILTKTVTIENQAFSTQLIAPKIIDYQFYDNQGNLLQANNTGKKSSYSYGYNGQYLIAEVQNANKEEIVYEDFEGNGSIASNLMDKHTGNGGYNGSIPLINYFSPTLNGKTYVLSYFKYDGTTWNYIQENYSGQTISGILDDIRIHPVDAQMTTYTYEPLVGMTSMTDPSGRTTYYEYDSFQRLRYVRDQDRNILKVYCYNYAGQSIDCFAEVVPPPPVASTIYARIEYSNDSFYSVYNSFDDYTDYHSAEVTIKLYSDAACTIPHTLTSNMNVSIDASYTYSSPANNGSSTFSDGVYTVLSGTSSISIGTRDIESTHYYNDPYYGYFYDAYTYQYYTVNDGTNNYISQ